VRTGPCGWSWDHVKVTVGIEWEDGFPMLSEIDRAEPISRAPVNLSCPVGNKSEANKEYNRGLRQFQGAK
jgi:hypothetical protein